MNRKENRPMNQQQHQQQSKCNVRKQLVRTTDATPIRKVKIINHNICDNDNDDIDDNRAVIARKQLLSMKCPPISNDKLAAPELRSTLLIAKKLDALRLTKPIQTVKTLDELTPRSKAVANEKVWCLNAYYLFGSEPEYCQYIITYLNT